MKGIIAKVYDQLGDTSEWRERLKDLSKFFTFWTDKKLSIPIDFQEQVVAMPQRHGMHDTQVHKESVQASLNWRRGQYLMLGFEYMVFIYDTWDPWLYIPEKEPNPISTGAFTNIADTVVLGYVEPQYVGGEANKEVAIRKNLSYVISLELLHCLLYKKQLMQGIRPDPRYFDDLVHQNHHDKVIDTWPDGYVTLGGVY